MERMRTSRIFLEELRRSWPGKKVIRPWSICCLIRRRRKASNRERSALTVDVKSHPGVVQTADKAPGVFTGAFA